VRWAALLLLAACHYPAQPWDRLSFQRASTAEEIGFTAANPIAACGKRETETAVLPKLICDDRRAGPHPVYLSARHAAAAYRGVRDRSVLIYEARCEDKIYSVYIDISRCAGNAPDGDADFETPASPARSDKTPHD
jgi:hypothetical protein